MTLLTNEHFELHSRNKAKMKNIKKKMIILMLIVDADLVIYKITSSLEEPIDWGDDEWTLHSDLGKGKTAFTAKPKSL